MTPDDKYQLRKEQEADAMRVAVAQAIAKELLRQDYDDDELFELGYDLKLAYLDQGEVDFGLVAEAAMSVCADALRAAIAERDEALARLDEWQNIARSWKTSSQTHEARLEEAKAVLEPFGKAAAQLDDGVPLKLRCEDDYRLGDALWSEQQPTVGDLRRARAFLQPTGGTDGR